MTLMETFGSIRAWSEVKCVCQDCQRAILQQFMNAYRKYISSSNGAQFIMWFWRQLKATLASLLTVAKFSTIDGASWHILGTMSTALGNILVVYVKHWYIVNMSSNQYNYAAKVFVVGGNDFFKAPTVTKKNCTLQPRHPCAAKACPYFRQKWLIGYDREKMRVWGRWRLQILPNNQEDASDRPVSPSCACYLISFILLINFTGMKVCVGASHHAAHRMRGNQLKQESHPNSFLPGHQWTNEMRIVSNIKKCKKYN